MRNRSRTRYITVCAMLTAFTLILSYIEAILPFDTLFSFAGIKLGLANIGIVITLHFIGIKGTLVVAGLKVFMTFLMFGNPVMFALSTAGTFLSILVMIILNKLSFNIIVTSTIGGIAHNIGQLITISFIMSGFDIFSLLYVLFVAGLVFGLIIGIVSQLVISTLERSGYDRLFKR